MGNSARVYGGFTALQGQTAGEALERRERIDYECFLKLQQLLRYVDTHDPEIKRAVKEAEKLITQRDRANHDFLAALTARG